MAVLTALTAQNTQGVRAVHVPPVDFLRAQLDAVSDDIVIDAVKIGMLADAEVIRAVGAWLDRVRPPVVVLDPVMVATSGDRLLDPEAERALHGLLARATLVTPNLAELAVLAGREIADWEDAISAAHELSARIDAAVLVKGGHLVGDEAPDALVDAARGLRRDFPGRRITTGNTHGTGCSLSSALATLLARGHDAEAAVGAARIWLREALRAGTRCASAVGTGRSTTSPDSGNGREQRPVRSRTTSRRTGGTTSGRSAPRSTSCPSSARSPTGRWSADRSCPISPRTRCTCASTPVCSRKRPARADIR